MRTSQPLRMIPLSPKAYPATPGAIAELAPITAVKHSDEQVFTIKRGMPTHWFLLVP